MELVLSMPEGLEVSHRSYMKQSGIIFQYKKPVTQKLEDVSIPDDVSLIEDLIDEMKKESIPLNNEDVLSERTKEALSEIPQKVQSDESISYIAPPSINFLKKENVLESDSQSAVSSNRKKASHAFTGLFIGGILGLFVLLSPLLFVEARYRLQTVNQTEPVDPAENVKVQELQETEESEKDADFSKRINARLVQALSPVDPNFGLIIPKIGVNSAVTPNIDPKNKDQYTQALKNGAAQSAGSYLPGQGGTTYIFAHSTDYVWNITQYNAIFYLLKELQPDDTVYIVYKETLYPYKVTETKIVDPNDTFYLFPNPYQNQLILQTCWPPGTTLKRLLVFAEPDDPASKSLVN